MNKKLYIAFCFLLFACSLVAQTQKVKNQPYGDQKLYHFGITAGLNFQDLIITNAGIPHTLENGTTENWYGTIPDYSPGFSVGLLVDLYLNPFMNLRLSPTLHFGDKKFEFVEPETKETYKTNVRSNYLTFPLDVKIRSMRLNNYRPYVIAGVYGAIDLGRRKDEAILLKAMDYGLTFGFGCDFYLPIVKVAPELRFYFGLADLFEKDRSDLTDESLRKYQECLSKGTSRMITLTFNFE